MQDLRNKTDEIVVKKKERERGKKTMRLSNIQNRKDGRT